MRARNLIVVAAALALLACNTAPPSAQILTVHATRVDANGARSDVQLDATLTGYGPGEYCIQAGSIGAFPAETSVPCATASWVLTSSDGSFALSISEAPDGGVVQLNEPVALGAATGTQLTLDGAPLGGTFTLTSAGARRIDGGIWYFDFAAAFEAQGDGVQLVDGYIYTPGAQ